MKPIVIVPHEVLTTVAKPVTVFDKKLKTLIREMEETLIHADNPKGVGLAAPQIGASYRLFMIRPTEKSTIRTFINPEIITMEESVSPTEKDYKFEGCLSIPKIWGKVKRAKKLTITYQDTEGAKHTETFTGFPAVIIQHETDHINGILYTQRVLEQNGKFYQTEKDDHGEEVLKEIPV